jgi:DNA invertase Pin-like site-specific DNA recombinase
MGRHHYSHGALTLTVLGGLAVFEPDLIRSRTGEGRARAQARGVKMERKSKLTLDQRAEAAPQGSNAFPRLRGATNVHNGTISRLTA